MNPSSLTRALPLVAVLIAGMAAFAPGCGDDPPPGGRAGNIGPGGSGGTGGAGGSGGSEKQPCTTNEECAEAGQICKDGFCEPNVCTDDDDCPGDWICEDGTCKEPCLIDSQCGFHNGKRCDDDPQSPTFGHCITGEFCQDDSNCGYDKNDEHTYCDGEDVECVCVEDESVPDNFSGVCRRRTPTCAFCVSDADCGPNATQFEDPAKCVDFNVDGETAAVCLPVRRGRCPPGTLPADPTKYPDLVDYCLPPSGDCADYRVCESDEDCEDNPAAPFCDPTARVCKAGCRFNYKTGRSEGCAPTEVCHAVPRWVDANLAYDCATAPYFGQGKCGSECNTDVDCSRFDGGTNTLICVTEDSGEKRCRPKSTVQAGQPACLDDAECPEDPTLPEYLGYCKLSTDPTKNECVYDSCRLGADPRAGCGSNTPYPDCDQDYKCVPSSENPNIGQCIEKNCIDWGGANVKCKTGQFCAGEPLKDINTGEEVGPPLDFPASVPEGTCYSMDENLWCNTPCDACNGVDGPTDYPDMPRLCDGTRCLYACKHQQECPANWLCAAVNYAKCGVGAPVFQLCSTDDDCGGAPCVDPITRGKPYGFSGNPAPFKVCACTESGSCSAPGYSCNAGVGTVVHNPLDPEYGKRVHRYCVADQAMQSCGDGGSCEWFGDLEPLDPMDPQSPLLPQLRCAGTPADGPFPGDGPAQQVKCPDGLQPGWKYAEQFTCFLSQVCLPRAVGDLECGVAP